MTVGGHGSRKKHRGSQPAISKGAGHGSRVEGQRFDRWAAPPPTKYRLCVCALSAFAGYLYLSCCCLVLAGGGSSAVAS